MNHFGFWQLFSLAFLITAVPIAIVIILEKRSPFKTISWLLTLILLPVIGIFFYLFFGQEFRKRKLFSRKGIKSLSELRRLTSKQLREFNEPHANVDPEVLQKKNIIRLLLNNSDALLTTGNQLKILHNGVETFEHIFDAIKNARHHIHLEYYIFANDEIGNKMKDLLIAKSQEGVEVRVIIDDVGSWGLKRKFLSQLRRNGVQIFPFMKVRFPRLTSRVNFRNHRKIIVVDGKIGFTGGINIADRYLNGLPRLGAWRDTHLQIIGDAVDGLQVVFAADWFFVSKENLAGDRYFPPLKETIGTPVQISASGPDSDWENIGQAFFAAISNARKLVYITTPYLMPPSYISLALKTAALSDVDVRILIPGVSDAITPKWCSLSYVEKLLEAGVRIYTYQAGFVHCKTIIVDEIFSSIGTTNLDFRSIETNFEVNAFIYEKAFTQKMIKQFKADLRNSREIKLAEWKLRPWHHKFRESLAHIVSPLM